MPQRWHILPTRPDDRRRALWLPAHIHRYLPSVERILEKRKGDPDALHTEPPFEAFSTAWPVPENPSPGAQVYTTPRGSFAITNEQPQAVGAEPCRVTTKVGWILWFSFHHGGDTHVTPSFYPWDFAVHMTLMANPAEPHELATALRTLDRCGAGDLFNLLQAREEPGSDLEEASRLLFERYPDGLPPDAALPLLEHTDRAIRELALTRINRRTPPRTP